MSLADIERLKDLLPTTLGSAEIREQIAADILRRSVFSARMASASYIARIRDVATAMAAGEINLAKARELLLRELERLGVDTTGARPADLRDPASERRLNLIVETQREMAASAALILSQNEGTVEMFPAWLLTRLAGRRIPREDWAQRWSAAGESVGWQGAYSGLYRGTEGTGYIALKGSPVWQALGDGVGGFMDTLRNPFPPFAYASGMGWLQVGRETCERLGLLAPGETAEAPEAPSLSPSEREIAEAAKRYGFDASYFADILEEI